LQEHNVLDFEFPVAFITKKSRAEDIVGIIKEGIIRGYWKPNEKIDDGELAKRLNVSRITVREALSKLVERRLIEKKHWKGFAVRYLSWEEIDSLIDIRIVLEELALKKIIQTITPNLIHSLEQSINEAKEAVERKDFHGFSRSDYQFHQIIQSESGNPWIKDILEDLHVLISIVRYISQWKHPEEVAKKSISEHERIVESLKQGNGNEAIRYLHEHFNNHRERVRMEYQAS